MPHGVALGLLKAAFFRPGPNASSSHCILLAAGAILSLLGVCLTRLWSLPFFLFAALCFASLGASAAERADALGPIVAGLVSGPGTADRLMLLWLGAAAWLAGLFVARGPWKAPVRMARPCAPQAAGAPILKLTGTEGLVTGSTFVLAEGARVVVGRSQGCGISLHAIGASATKGAPEARAFRSISRRHAVVRFAKGEVEVVAKSRHGTFVDGDRIDTVVLTDLDSRPHTLRLGAADTFRMELVRA